MERSVALRRTAPVAVFAAVLGGVLLVNGRSTTSSSREPRPLPISAAAGRGGAEDSAYGTSSPAMALYGETRIPDSLLAGLPAEGPAYTLTADESRIEALARALGLDGEPRKTGGTWVVGSGDKTLSVMPYAGTPWYLGTTKGEGREPAGVSGSGSAGWTAYPPATPAPGEKPATEPAKPTAEPVPPDAPCTASSDGASVCVEPVPGTAPHLPPALPAQPSDATARAVMDTILDAVGQRGATVTTTPGYAGKEVTAAPVVDGLPTVGYGTHVTVDAAGGIVHASGFLSRPELDARYPLLGAREAVARGGIGHGRGDIGIAVPEPAVAPSGAPGTAPAPAPVREATGVRLGLMFMPSYEPGGAAFLVPAWLLAFEGASWEEPYVALPDRYIAQPPAPSGDPDQPVCDPSPCPTKDVPPPPDGGTGGGSGGSEPGSTGAPEYATDSPATLAP